MIHEGLRLAEEIKRLQRQLEKPISENKRREIQQAIKNMEAKKREWERPH